MSRRVVIANSGNTLKYPLVDYNRKPVNIGDDVEICHSTGNTRSWGGYRTVRGKVNSISPYGINIVLDEDTQPIHEPNRMYKAGDMYNACSPWDFDHNAKMYVGRKDINYSPELDRSTYIKKIR